MQQDVPTRVFNCHYFSSTAASSHPPMANMKLKSVKCNYRNCLFSDELPILYGNGYSFSNCITLCRIRSIRALCGCMLFRTPILNQTTQDDTIYCDLQQKECLMRYDFKWFNVITKRHNVDGLEREMEDSLYCPECLPSCSETRYSVQTMSLPLSNYNMKSFPDYQENYSDLALVHIFFAEKSVLYFRRVLLNSWYENFSYVGNICGIITGFSLIGICEVVFFFIKQILGACKHEVLCEGNRNTTAHQTLTILP